MSNAVGHKNNFLYKSQVLKHISKIFSIDKTADFIKAPYGFYAIRKKAQLRILRKMISSESMKHLDETFKGGYAKWLRKESVREQVRNCAQCRRFVMSAD